MKTNLNRQKCFKMDESEFLTVLKTFTTNRQASRGSVAIGQRGMFYDDGGVYQRIRSSYRPDVDF